ncbi:hypothetical protein BU16DRAFT_544623 [Lophium mytilinum]|uniref:Uncharacterized protein n=1 Tax=Lophium mytilinum TaxID=390894 RepID=A0A6A6QCM9_9PEZI|nr:hypothetical protein BU16DRAFT_544623 [Lophium mytilinum]
MPSFPPFAVLDACGHEGVCDCLDSLDYANETPVERKQRMWIHHAGKALQSWYAAYAERVYNFEIEVVEAAGEVLHVHGIVQPIGTAKALPAWFPEQERLRVLMFQQCNLSLGITRGVVRLFEDSYDSPLTHVGILRVQSPEFERYVALHPSCGMVIQNSDTDHVSWIMVTKDGTEYVQDITGAQVGLEAVTYLRDDYLSSKCVSAWKAREFPADAECEALVEAAIKGDELQLFHAHAGQRFFEIVKAFMHEEQGFLHLENGDFEEALVKSTTRVWDGMGLYMASLPTNV